MSYIKYKNRSTGEKFYRIQVQINLKPKILHRKCRTALEATTYGYQVIQRYNRLCQVRVAA